MVRSGEVSGDLDGVLLRLADYMEATAELKRRIRGANVRPTKVCHGRPLWDCDHEPSMGISELRPLIRVELDRVSVLMDIMVMRST